MCGYIVDSKAIFITALLFSAGMFWINKLVFFYPLNLPTVSLLVYVSAYKSCDLPFLFNVECYKKQITRFTKSQTFRYYRWNWNLKNDYKFTYTNLSSLNNTTMSEMNLSPWRGYGKKWSKQNGVAAEIYKLLHSVDFAPCDCRVEALIVHSMSMFVHLKIWQLLSHQD